MQQDDENTGVTDAPTSVPAQPSGNSAGTGEARRQSADIVRLHDMIATVSQLDLPNSLDALIVANDVVDHAGDTDTESASGPFHAIRILGSEDIRTLARERHQPRTARRQNSATPPPAQEFR